MPEPIGRMIQRRRKELGLEAGDLAEAIGMSKSAVQSIESGRTKSLSPGVVRALAETLEISRLDLVIALGYLDPSDVPGVAVAERRLEEAVRALDAARRELERYRERGG